MIEMLMRFRADASGVDRALAHTRQAGKKAAAAIGKELEDRIGRAFTAGALIDGIQQFVSVVAETVGEVKDLSEQLDLSAESVQNLQAGANKAGVSMSVVTTALGRISDLRAQALAGDKKANDLFSILGIDPSKGTDLDALVRAIESASKGAKEQAAVFDLLGKKANLLRNVVVELQKLGPINIFDDDAIRAVDSVSAAIKDIKRNLVASAAPEIGFWGRALKRANEIDATSKGAFNFALTRGILGEMMSGTEGGVDLSPLPLPIKAPTTAAISQVQQASAAVSLGTRGDALSRIGLFVGGRPEARSLASIERNTAVSAKQTEQATKVLRSIEELLQSL